MNPVDLRRYRDPHDFEAVVFFDAINAVTGINVGGIGHGKTCCEGSVYDQGDCCANRLITTATACVSAWPGCHQ